MPLHFGVAAQILEAAVSHHPKLLDQLIFPCTLQPSTTTKAGATSVSDASKAKDQDKSSNELVVVAKRGEYSALDGLLDFVKRSSQMRASSPEVTMQ
jgi:hypothetical protein